ncbi:MAG: M42 family peptidase [Planctomycetota bacterium]|nr:MAG: M42 family peptidase [Planctomycetota bacterium]
MDTELFRRLCETPGIPGREERVRALIIKETKGLFDSCEVDAMGSYICTRKPTRTSKSKSAKPTRVMLAAHMDEIGFFVRHIDENGCIWVNPAGGFDARNLFAVRVLVCTASGDYKGVMNPGGKPIHISSDAERNKVPGVEEFFIDLGRDAADVRKHVEIGDFVVLDTPFLETPKKFVSKAVDNRLACFVAIEAVRMLAKRKSGHACEIVCAFTTQEEVGLRGAQTAAYSVKADIGIGLDVTLACDTPGVPDNQRVTKQGLGAGIMVQDSSMISDYELVAEFVAVAKKHRIPHQKCILPRGGQDGAAIQRAGIGAKCVAIVTGTRYVHTSTEMVDKGDLEATIELLGEWLGSVA